MKGRHFGVCDLDCGACPAFIATKNNDKKLREKTAKEWTERYGKTGRNRLPVNPEDISCRGCLSRGPVYLYCLQCKIRECGLKKKIKNCKQCDQYRCEKLIELQKHFY